MSMFTKKGFPSKCHSFPIRILRNRRHCVNIRATMKFFLFEGKADLFQRSHLLCTVEKKRFWECGLTALNIY